MTSGDTIAAISSSVGVAARIVIRTSGPLSLSLARQLGASDDAGPGASTRPTIRFRDLIVPAWIYLFAAPRSYTGEDLVEYHLAGNPILAKLLLDELLARGARAAEPGEFTARAYFNGRMDLTHAEGVAATIAAGNEGELAAARRLLAGELAARLAPVLDRLTETLALVEVGIDFTEEDVSFLSRQQQRSRISEADEALDRLIADSTRFERLAHEPHIVLVGRPNAGKSTLLNALAGRERAVVSPVAGTTRDVLTAEITLPHGLVRISDVAGIEQHSTLSEIERQMQANALRAAKAADVLVLVEDLTDTRPSLTLAANPSLIVRTKLDLASSEADLQNGIAVSTLTGQGMNELRERLDAACFKDASAARSLALNLRHLRAIEDARAALSRASQAVAGAGAEVLALDLREAIDAIGNVLGQVTPDDVLGHIFSGFCIGK
jgi:tRNA modification GTPase